MTAKLPYGGSEIAEIRAKRQKPADMVLVSLVGGLREINPVVIARPEKIYDWRFLFGLEVLIVADSSIDKCLVKRVIEAVAAIKPSYLGLWLTDKQNGAHIAWGEFRPKSKAMRWMTPFDRRNLSGVGK